MQGGGTAEGQEGGAPRASGVQRSVSKGGDEFQGEGSCPQWGEGGRLLPPVVAAAHRSGTGVHWREGPEAALQCQSAWVRSAGCPVAHATGTRRRAGPRQPPQRCTAESGSAAALRRTVGGCSRRLPWLLPWLRASVAHALLQILQLIVDGLADRPAGRQLQGGRTQQAGSVSSQREELATTHACR